MALMLRASLVNVYALRSCIDIKSIISIAHFEYPFDHMGIKGLLVRGSSPVDSLCCVLEQDTLSAA